MVDFHHILVPSQPLAKGSGSSLESTSIKSTSIDDDALRDLAKQADLATSDAAGLVEAAAPIGRWLAARSRQQDRALVVGVSGAQGSGKSTFCQVLAALLRKLHGREVCGFSLDDLYLTRAERQQLAAEVHALLRTRGVPGTHDVSLGLDLLERLRQMKAEEVVAIPSFSKALDDRRPEPEWPVCRHRPDLVLFEGWCVGIGPQSETELSRPINSLEATEDPDGSWRRYVNHLLGTTYAQLFAKLDVLVVLQVPDFESVRRWRRLQEAKLARRHPEAPERMDTATLDRFVAHYERLTRHGFATLPDRADVLCRIAPDHRIVEIASREELPLTPMRSPSQDP